jgi:hypothetical protein
MRAIGTGVLASSPTVTVHAISFIGEREYARSARGKLRSLNSGVTSEVVRALTAGMTTYYLTGPRGRRTEHNSWSSVEDVGMVTSFICDGPFVVTDENGRRLGEWRHGCWHPASG